MLAIIHAGSNQGCLRPEILPLMETTSPGLYNQQPLDYLSVSPDEKHKR